MFKVLLFFHRSLRAIANRVLDKSLINPRKFSNKMLRLYAPVFSGSVINVSGWDDRDKEGSYYREYFAKRTGYVVSNAPAKQKGFGSMLEFGVEELELDLMLPLPEGLRRKFDVVLNHTTLEHVLDPQLAFQNICDLSKDVVIVIVPVIQNIHVKSSYGDYFRPTTLVIAKLFKKHGFEPMVIKTNDQPFAPIYCFAIGVREADKYKDEIVRDLDFQMGAYLYGSRLKKLDLAELLKEDVQNYA